MKKFLALLALLWSTDVFAQRTVTGDAFQFNTVTCKATSGTTDPSGGNDCDIYFKSDGTVWNKIAGYWVRLSSDYVQARGLNLVTNGTGLLGNNYNFSSNTFIQTDVPGGRGAFKQVSGPTATTNDEYMPVDAARAYRMQFQAKELVDASKTFYAGIANYDIDKLLIFPQDVMRQSGTDTTLASPLTPGDTTITLTSASSWYSGADSYRRQLILWRYKNSYGYQYPDYTYSKMHTYNWKYSGGYDTTYITSGLWAESGISGNVITLAAPWPSNMGNPDNPPTYAWPAGTPVSNSTSGGTYDYSCAAAIEVPSAWTSYSCSFLGTDSTGNNVNGKFRPGTSYVRLLFLWNYPTGPSSSEQAVGNVWFSELTSWGLEAATTTAPGVVSTTTQSFTGLKTFTSGLGPTDIISTASDQLKLSYDGSYYTTLVVNSAGTLSVAPTTGAMYLSKAALNNSLYVMNYGGTGAWGQYQGNNASLVDNSVTKVQFSTAGNSYVNAGYHFGIGTNDPGYRLDVRYDGTYQMALRGAADPNNRLYIGYDTVNNVGKIQAITEGTLQRPLYLNPAGGPVSSGSDLVTDLGATALRWRAGYFGYLLADELHAKAFTADLESALVGGQMIAKTVAVVATAFTLPAAGASTTFIVEDVAQLAGTDVFVANDYIRFRVFTRTANSLDVADAWGQVTATAHTHNGDGTQTWTFVRSSGADGGTASGTIAKGQLVIDYGVSGNGIIEATVLDTTSQANTPYTRYSTWTTHPKTGLVTQTQIGNLNGSYGYSSALYGLAAGTYADNYSFLTVDPTNGVRMLKRASSTDTTVVQLAPAGTLTLGATATEHVNVTSTSVQIKDGSTVYTDLTGGALLLGQTGASQSNVYLTSGYVALRNNTTERIRLNSDGSGFLADNNISWTTAGVASISGWTVGTGYLYAGTGTGRTALAAHATEYNAVVAADVPVAWWKLSETSGTTAADSSVGGTNTMTDTVTPTRGVRGTRPVKTAYSFDGVDDYMTGPTSQLFGGTNFADNFSVEWWGRWTASGGSVFSQSNNSYTLAQDRNYFICYLSSGTITCKLTNNAATAWTVSSVAATYADSLWHHVVMTRSGTTWSLYIDGVLDNTATNTLSGTIDAMNRTALGTRIASDDHGGHPTMWLQDVAWYTRALGADEVLEHYNASKAMWAGATLYENAPWQVGNNGNFAAYSGVIGGYTVGTSSLSSAYSTYGVGLVVPTDQNSWVIYAGDTTPSSAEFRVQADGEMVSNRVSISAGSALSVDLGTAGLAMLTGTTTGTYSYNRVIFGFTANDPGGVTSITLDGTHDNYNEFQFTGNGLTAMYWKIRRASGYTEMLLHDGIAIWPSTVTQPSDYSGAINAYGGFYENNSKIVSFPQPSLGTMSCGGSYVTGLNADTNSLVTSVNCSEPLPSLAEVTALRSLVLELQTRLAALEAERKR